MSQAGQGGYQGAGFQVDISYPLIAIRNIQVNRAFNDHSHCKLDVVMTEETATTCLEKGSFTDTIQIRRELETGTQYWFSGGITGVDIEVEDGIWHVSIQAISRTYDMDQKRKSRSYQNKNTTYTALIKELVAPYPGGGAMNEATHPDAKIGELLVQYEETDWEFLRRVASKVGTVILPDVVMDAPRVYFGVPDFSWGKSLEAVHYTVTQNQERTLKLEGSHQDISYRVHSHDYVQVGDNVSFRGQMWVVYEAEMDYHEGITVYSYQLVQRANIRSMVKQNHRIQGVSLGGKVVQRGNNMVKVHLDVDDQHDEGGNWWFPYSSEGNNMFHALPEEGARINVYFPGGKEKQAIAINSVRGKHEEMKGRTVFEKPSTKVFHIPGNAKMELGEDGVLFEKNTVRLHLNAGDIRLEADDSIMLVGSEEIKLGSAEQMPDYIKMQAEMRITLLVGQQFIEIDEGRTLIQGQQINMEKVEMSLLDMLTEEELEDLYADSLMGEAEDAFKAEKGREQSAYMLPNYGGRYQKQEIEITAEERSQIRVNVKKQVSQDPQRKTKVKAYTTKQGDSALASMYKRLQKEGAEVQAPLTSDGKAEAMKNYQAYYKTYVSAQTRRNDPGYMARLADRDEYAALREENEQQRASARNKERAATREARPREISTPSLGKQLWEGFLLAYIVPQKPDYWSKNQSEDTQYSRYYIEQFIISGQKKQAENDQWWGGFEIVATLVGAAVTVVVAVVFAAPTGGTSLYLIAVAEVLSAPALASLTHGIAQVSVSEMKLNELAEGNYYTPNLDKWQEGLDVTGTALAIVDLGMLSKSVARGLRNLANDTKRAAMLTKVKPQFLNQSIDKIGSNLGKAGKTIGRAGKTVSGAVEDAKSAFNIGKTGQLGLEGAGVGGSAGRTGSRAVEGPEVWYSSGSGKGTSNSIGKIVKDGNKTKYTNPAGNELSWIDQHPKSINNDIDAKLKSTDPGKATEAKVASFVRENKEVTGFGQQVKKADNSLAGDLDVVTKDEIIEVKKSIKAITDVEQFDKYINPNNVSYFNPGQKKVILYIDKPLTNLHPNDLKKLQVIKSKGVTIVNSLDELKEALK